MSLAETTHLYPTRSSQLPFIKKTRRQIFKNVFGDYKEDTTPNKEVTDKEFILLNTAFNLNLNYCTHILDLAFNYGAVNVLVAYLSVQLTLGIPIFMLYVFLSTYSKKSFMTFWECAPLFEGLGYTLGICRFGIEIYNVTIACLSLMLVSEIVYYKRRENITKCWNTKNDNLCIVTASLNTSAVCKDTTWAMRTKNETVYIPLQYHFRYNVLKYDQFNPDCCTVNVNLLLSIMGMWLLIFALSVLDLDRINKVTANAKIFIIIMMSSVCLYSLPFMRVNDKPLTFSSVYMPSVTDIQFWVDMMHHGGETNILSNILWLGSMRRQNSFPIHAVLIIAPLKLVVTVLMLCYSSRVSHDAVKYYKLKDSSCLSISGLDFFLSFVPETLLRTRFGGMGAALWYLGLCFSSIITPIYSLIALVNTIIEKYNPLGRYRAVVYLTLSVIGMLINLILTINYNMAIMYVFRFFGLALIRTIILFLVILALMFIYSTKRIIDDYSFTYGSPPNRYWIVFWRAAPTFTLIAFIFTLYQLKGSVKLVSVYVVAASYILTFIMLSPIVLTLIIKCCIHVKYRTLGQLSRPAGTWGPHNPINRQARKYFYPQRDVKYRNTKLKCMHECIVNNKHYVDEIRNQDARIKRIVSELEKMGNYKFSDLKEDIDEDYKKT